MVDPISFQRSTNMLKASSMLSALRDGSAKMIRAERQILTQRSILDPSDNPTGAAEALLLIAERARTERHQSNRAQAITRLEDLEQPLLEISQALSEAKVFAVEGQDSTSTRRGELATALDLILEQMVIQANTQKAGQYLFGGTKTEVTPFEFADGYVAYRGNEEKQQVFLDKNTKVEYTLDGHNAFGALSNRIIGSVDLNPKATSDTRLQNLNEGRGVRLGTLKLQVAYRNTVSPRTVAVDLGQAVTLGDVVTLINGAADNQVKLPTGANERYVTASITGGRLVIQPGTNALAGGADNIVMSAEGVGNSPVADDLGLVNQFTGGIITVGDQNAASVTLRVNGGAPTVVITGGNTSANKNAQDLATAINLGMSTQLRAEASGDQVFVRVLNGGILGNSLDIDQTAVSANLTVTYNGGHADGLLASSELAAKLTLKTDLRDLRISDPNDATGVDRIAAFDFGGFTITNGTMSRQISLASINPATTSNAVPTVEKLIGLINSSGTEVEARINAKGTGLELVSRVAGTSLTVSNASGSNTAKYLGIEANLANTSLKSLNNGIGLNVAQGDDFRIYTHDSTVRNADIPIDIPDPFSASPQPTLSTIVDRINQHANNQYSADPAVGVAAPGVLGRFVHARVDNSTQTVILEDRTVLQGVAAAVGAPSNGQQITVSVNVVGGATVTKTFTAASAGAPGVDGSFGTLDELIEEINGDSTLNPTGTRNLIAIKDGDQNLRLLSPTGIPTIGEIGAGTALLQAVGGTGAQGASTFRVEAENSSEAPTQLGLIQDVGQNATITSTTLTPSGQKQPSVFSVVAQLRDALRANDIGAIGAIHLEIDSARDLILTQVERVGARVKALGGEFAKAGDFDGSLKKLDERIGLIAGLDPVEAAIKLDEFRTLFTLGLQASARVVQVSLLDFL